MHEFLTSKEVADLLRIKERKLYELCAEGALPVTKVTGKLLFPRNALMAWLRSNTEYGRAMPALTMRPPVVAGSHDTLLEWALRASKSQLATWCDGSADGLERLGRAACVAAAIHFHDENVADPNASRISAALGNEPIVLMEWAKRTQGLIIGKSNAGSIRGIGDLAGKRVVQRQAGAGSQALLQKLLKAENLSLEDIQAVGAPALNENDVAQAVAGGHADAGLAIEAVARQYGLEFIPLEVERFDLAFWRRDWFEPPLQRLCKFTSTAAFRMQAEEFGGYDLSGHGTVHHNGP
jgi:putative molybdopterin biosynthesis protein